MMPTLDKMIAALFTPAAQRATLPISGEEFFRACLVVAFAVIVIVGLIRP